MTSPTAISLTPELFAEAFPFHVAVDHGLRILQTGRSLPRLVPAARTHPPERGFIRVVQWNIEKGRQLGRIIDVLRTVFDPEIPVNIYELGLVYSVDVDAAGHALVRMTLTSPGCPVAASLPVEVENKVLGVDGVTSARVELVWEPAWNPSMMTEAAKLQLGMY